MASLALLNLITAFAETGEIGPLRCGMGRDELEAALRDLGLITLAEPGPEDSDKFGSIEVHLTRGTLRLLGLDSTGDCSFEVPGTLARGSAGREHVSHEEVTGALARHGISWSEDSQLTESQEQLDILQSPHRTRLSKYLAQFMESCHRRCGRAIPAGHAP